MGYARRGRRRRRAGEPSLAARVRCCAADGLHHGREPLRLHLRRLPARHQGLGRGGRSNAARAEEPDRPALRPAARRRSGRADPSEKMPREGLREHARSVLAAGSSMSGRGPEYALRPAMLERSASSRAASHCCSLGHIRKGAGGRMRRAVRARLGRKRPGEGAACLKCLCTCDVQCEMLPKIETIDKNGRALKGSEFVSSHK